MKAWYHNNFYKRAVAVLLAAGIGLAFLYWLYGIVF